MSEDKSYYFCGIGGSGMLPLAMIVRATGAQVSGSDRALDQGRLADKFGWLEDKGIGLFPQDGSGLIGGDQILVASAAIEDSVPDVAKANALGCVRMTRAELLAEYFNRTARNIAIGGTSGKSTVTGMIGWILTEAALDPTIMNGAVMKNFVAADAPFASSRVGESDIIVSEVDESDGSIALFDAEIALLNNVSLDHKSLEELRQLFGDFLSKAKCAIWNADDLESQALVDHLTLAEATSFGFSEKADIRAENIVLQPLSSSFTLVAGEEQIPVEMKIPGRHNIANGLAAIAAARAVGVPITTSVAALANFTGLARRFDIVGSAHDISIIDDFGHNPDKIAATLQTLKAFPGRIIALFQPHGYGPIRKMGSELAEVFADILDGDDRVILCDPVYFGGTVDRSVGSQTIIEAINARGRHATHLPEREDCGTHILEIAKPGDRIMIMGARDDTLHSFAKDLLTEIGRRDFSETKSPA